MNKKYYENVDETLYSQKLDNGLELFILPKKDFSKTFVSLSTRYGSIHTKMKVNNQLEEYPAGIAHFLEHMLFQSDEGDVTDKFAEFGANPNAYTTYNITTYLFSTTSEVKTGIELLLDFVQVPAFSKDQVEKEKAIVVEEIKMYNDIPEVILFNEALRKLYRNHPIRDDIAGTIESVNKINIDNLMKAYKAYYNPGNLILFVCGNIDPGEIYSLVVANQERKSIESVDVVPIITKEGSYLSERHNINIDNSFPKALLGYRFDSNYTDLARSKISMIIYLEVLLGRSSKNYEILLNEKLINYSFGVIPYIDSEFFLVLIGGDSNNPNELLNRLSDIMRSEISLDEYKYLKQKYYGSLLQVFNSPEAIASEFVGYHTSGIDFFEIIDIIDSLSFEEVMGNRDYFLNHESIGITINGK